MKTEHKFISRGLELDTGKQDFAELRSSNDLLGDFSDLRKRLDEDGYLLLRNFHDPNVVQKAQECVMEYLLNSGCINTNYPISDRVASDNVINGGFIGNKLHDHPAIQEFLFEPKLISLFENLLGGEIRHFDYTWLRAIQKGQGTPPHADIVYMNRGTHDLYTTWVPYFDASYELGGLMVLENSHNQAVQNKIKKYLNLDVDTYCTNRSSAKDIEEGKKEWEHPLGGALSRNPVKTREKLGGRWLTTEYQAGDVLIFGMKLIHASLDNQTDSLRISSDSRYQLSNESIDERWIGEHPIGHSLAGKIGRIC